ncbi:hypothetical protein GCM10023318_13320 [Nocardia callitridis]|uniref:PH domain-containing protein n=1 Tax=Nocardia callitridis TaxID=648753 RepID=A0ABP9JY32_9NOCA
MAYPISVTIGALAVCAALAPFGTLDQVAALGAVALAIVGYTGYRFAVAFSFVSLRGAGTAGTVRVARVRQQHRLTSRSWLEFGEGRRTRWLPVYFDPALLTLTEGTAEVTDRAVVIDGRRLYPSGRLREQEPIGRLIDNPSRPACGPHLLAAVHLRRRLLLDAQSTVAAPFAALLWVYIDGGGFPAFIAATCVAAAATIWLSAIKGSDPS